MSEPRKRVLVVEDDFSIRRLLQRHLASIGVEVIEAPDARTAKARLSELRPDLVCLDLMLPESNGYALCEYMRGIPRLAEVPILIVSARGSIVDRAFAEESGVTHYLTKPFKREELLGHVGRLLNLEEPL
jgi:two-component system chemotaxis response regulator CheY